MRKKRRATQRRRPEKRSGWAWLVQPLTFHVALQIIKIISMVLRGWNDQ